MRKKAMTEDEKLVELAMRLNDEEGDEIATVLADRFRDLSEEDIHFVGGIPMMAIDPKLFVAEVMVQAVWFSAMIFRMSSMLNAEQRDQVIRASKMFNEKLSARQQGTEPPRTEKPDETPCQCPGCTERRTVVMETRQWNTHAPKGSA